MILAPLAPLRGEGMGGLAIEHDFIPVVLLRNSLDVGHHRIEIFPQEALFTVYRFIETREFVFRELLTRLLNSIDSSSYTLRQPNDLTPSRDSRQKFERLVKSMSNALSDGSRRNREMSHDEPSDGPESPTGRFDNG